MNTIDNNRKGKIILVDMFDKYERIDIKIIEKSQVFTCIHMYARAVLLAF